MRNYIILNNQNSNTISGLIIQELAPISKPLQRTQVETIDGRDGDIVTPLGYAAYNKKIKIGLYGNFDINEVIAYFATKGTVIFSNEPDKYYYYQIVDQIDYERLVRYRVATVTMHVQPFKYSATEGTITVDSSDTVSGEGSDIALDGTAEAPFNTLRHKGNATQTGKNKFNPTTLPASWTNTTPVYVTLNLKPNTTYTFSSNIPRESGNALIFFLQAGQSIGTNTNGVWGEQSRTLTTDSTGNNLQVVYRSFQGETRTRDDYQFQLEEGSSATSYASFLPMPDYPQDIQVVTGNSTVKITGKNLAEDIIVGGSIGASGNIGTNASYNMVVAQVMQGQTYTMTVGESTDVYGFFTSKPTIGSVSYDNSRVVATNQPTFTAPITGYVAFRTLATYATPQLEIGNTATAYEPYKGQSYVLPFGDTYLAKIGDYADEPVNVDGTWYIRRAVGKRVLDGSETWSGAPYGSVYRYNINFADAMPVSVVSDYVGKCDNFYFDRGVFSANTIKFGMFGQYIPQGSVNSVYFASDQTTVSNFKTWLSTHNTTVYYPLATPTDEAITDQDLIDALDEFFGQAHAYKGQTNITASGESGNAPAVLSVEVGEDNESIVTNAGNTTSRPIITIYGQGDIGVYINDVEVLDVALGDEGYITLDSVEMEAYKDSTANLKNRLVTGDYSKLALNAGANKIRFTGKVTKYEISKYSRWL